MGAGGPNKFMGGCGVCGEAGVCGEGWCLWGRLVFVVV